MNIVILGPQGSGKGTQAKKLADKFNLHYFDMGKFLREESKNNSMLDKIVNREGGFVPEDLSTPLAIKYLKSKVKNADNIIFDGVPRSVIQLEYIEKWLKNNHKKIDYAIFIHISEKESIKRLSKRIFQKSIRF